MGRYQKYREAVGREREFREEQRKLHRKHKEVDQDTVIVEKTNMLKFLLAYFRGIVKALTGILLILLAAIGILAMLYPGPRNEVIKVLYEIAAEISGFFI